MSSAIVSSHMNFADHGVKHRARSCSPTMEVGEHFDLVNVANIPDEVFEYYFDFVGDGPAVLQWLSWARQ